MTYNPSEKASYRWVIVQLDSNNEADKKSLDHAKHGIGYYIISHATMRGGTYIAAYKHFAGKLREGASFATPEQTRKLEDYDNNRYSWWTVDEAKREAHRNKQPKVYTNPFIQTATR